MNKLKLENKIANNTLALNEPECMYKQSLFQASLRF